jgi:hypothetical protein
MTDPLLGLFVPLARSTDRQCSCGNTMVILRAASEPHSNEMRCAHLQPPSWLAAEGRRHLSNGIDPRVWRPTRTDHLRRRHDPNGDANAQR